MGYHKTKIKKGELGKLSKIQEELDELQDAQKQGVRILMLCEIADLIGAIQAYLDNHLEGFKIQDALEMAGLTASAFKEGKR